MITIAKGKYQLSLKLKGAEMKSFLFNGEEFLWNQEQYWAKTSPVLFPFVGGLKNQHYYFEGKEYPFNFKHGFARDHEFTVVEEREGFVKLALFSSPETLVLYPWDFEFYIIYNLTDNGLEIDYEVVNKTDREMLFSLGAHPAFVLPENYEDACYLSFPEAETSQKFHLQPSGLFLGKEDFFSILENAKELPLKEEYFADDAIVFNDLKSQAVTLANRFTSKSLTLDFTGFPYIAFWKVPKAPFLCLEPWYGIGDFEDHDGKLEEKEGIQRLEACGTFKASLKLTCTNS